jgi:hypothetical protein
VVLVVVLIAIVILNHLPPPDRGVTRLSLESRFTHGCDRFH